MASSYSWKSLLIGIFLSLSVIGKGQNNPTTLSSPRFLQMTESADKVSGLKGIYSNSTVPALLQ